ncbi:1,4-dihydroxy-6-naphthoate synthase [soil metagenome]
MKLSLGFSPCPNDTFIFDAVVNKKIDTDGIEFDVHLEDVQTLNQWALEGKLDISKISYGVLPLVFKNYTLLNAGGALGVGVGPLLIGKTSLHALPGEPSGSAVNNAMIAIPGQNTTAHFLFSLAYPHAAHKMFMRFDEIENFVLNPPEAFVESGTDLLGVIIHENRFTYQQRGLHKIIDLGDYWEKTTGNPVPLGGIIMKQYPGLVTKVNRLIKKSLEFAFKNYPTITPYVKEHSQQMSESVMRKHIDLYVNRYSLDLGEKGKAAVMELLNVYSKVNNVLPFSETSIFMIE